MNAHRCRRCRTGLEIAILPDHTVEQRRFYVGTRCRCGAYSRETLSTSLVGAIAAFDRVEL
jgi:hypothetical protein